MLDDCRITAQNDKPADYFTARAEKGHGRIEQREVQVFRNFYPTDPQWNGLIAEMVMVKRIREVFDTTTKQYNTSEEIIFYISTTTRTAEEYNTIIRNHWGVENRLHNVRDVALNEDASRIRCRPQNMARIRSFALNILRANNISNIQNQLYKNALNFKNLNNLNYLYA